jgi:hypothetical protein
MKWEKILTNYVSGKGLASRIIYKTFYNLAKKYTIKKCVQVIKGLPSKLETLSPKKDLFL